MAKFCIKCGAPFSAEPICVKCGADIRNLAESAEHQSPTPSAHAQPPQNAPLPSATIRNGFTWLESKPLSGRPLRGEINEDV
jgi:DNA-directed RNA polymerase subunit RPC12/RpoP